MKKIRAIKNSNHVLLKILKLSVLTGFFSVIFGAFLDNNTTVIASAGVTATLLINMLLVIKGITILYIILNDLKSLIESFSKNIRLDQIKISIRYCKQEISHLISVYITKDIQSELGVLRY